MAVPFNLPSDESTEQNYQRLNDLFLTLYEVLRQILMHSEPQQTTRQQVNNSQQRNTSSGAAPSEPTPPPTPPPPSDARLPLPDLVECATAPTAPRRPRRRSCATSTGTVPPRPPRRRRRTSHELDDAVKETRYRYATDARGGAIRKIEMRDNWSQVGEDLRKIADEFHHTSLHQDHEDAKSLCLASRRGVSRRTPDLAASGNGKGAGLLSLLVPQPFNGSLWMAVIFLVGWGVLQRAR